MTRAIDYNRQSESRALGTYHKLLDFIAGVNVPQDTADLCHLLRRIHQLLEDRCFDDKLARGMMAAAYEFVADKITARNDVGGIMRALDIDGDIAPGESFEDFKLRIIRDNEHLLFMCELVVIEDWTDPR